MKKLSFFWVLMLLPAWVWAQQQVAATEIIAKINKGEAVMYKDAVITGILNLTQLNNKVLRTLPGRDGKTEGKEYTSTVMVPLSFVNCTFKGDVLAYFNPENNDEESENQKIKVTLFKNEVYNANFEKEVRFENCVFEQKSAFKYSQFRKAVSFAGSTFHKNGVFKYTRFMGDIDYSRAVFKEEANFKYVKFPQSPLFSGAVFEKEANFKYAQFPQGVSFENANFKGLANFKESELGTPLRLQGVAFSGGEDCKYTRINNKLLSLSAYQEKKKQDSRR